MQEISVKSSCFSLYHSSATEQSPGFRLQRDPQTKFFILDVSDNENLWRIYIKDFPKTWFHFAFTWLRQQRVMSPNEGLRVYIDGQLKLDNLFPRRLHQNQEGYSRSSRIVINERDLNKITFGKVWQDFHKAGKFQLGHLGIWKRALGSEEIKKVYTVNVKQSSKNEFCCNSKRIEGKQYIWFVIYCLVNISEIYSIKTV